MHTRRIGGFAALITVLAIATDTLPTLLLQRWIVDGPGSVGVGTPGELVVLTQFGVSIVAMLLTLGLAGWLGYRNADRVPAFPGFTGLLTATLIGSAIGVLLAWGAVLVLGSTFAVTPMGVVLGVVSLLEAFVNYTLVIGAATIAGAAIGHVTRPGPPTDDTDSGRSIPDAT